MKVDKVKVGLVGLGLVSSSHIKGYLSHPRADVVAVCDLDEYQLQRVARKFDIPRYYTSYDEMLTDTDINTIDVMTPTYLHRPMAVAAARAGKNIHCEKPLALTLAEGEQICNEAEKHNVALAVDETYVFMATIVKARELIDAGAIGKPRQIPAALRRVARPCRSSRGGPWWPYQSRAVARRLRQSRRQRLSLAIRPQYSLLCHRAVPDGRLPIKEVYSVKADNSWLRDRAQIETGKEAADNLYEVNTAEDIPLMTWTYEDPACQGVWMRAEHLNGKYDFMTGFSVTVIGEHGLIELLGEGGGGLYWDGRPVHLVLHRDGKEPETLRFDDEGPDDIWESEVSYYSRAHAHRMHEFVDSMTSGHPSRYTGRDGLRDLRVRDRVDLFSEGRNPNRGAGGDR